MKKIIVVDDEQFIANSIAKLIQKFCVDLEVVGIFYSSERALSYIENHDVDIVVTDIQMPEINGLELISRINNINSSIQMIIVTGFGTFEYAKQAMELGVKFIFQKPVNPLELTKALEHVMEASERSKKVHSLFTADQLNHYLTSNSQEKPKIDNTFSWFMIDTMHTDIFDSQFKNYFPEQELISGTIHAYSYYLIHHPDTYSQVTTFINQLTAEEGLLLYKHDVDMTSLKEITAQGEKMLNLQFYYPEFHVLEINHHDYLDENKYKRRFDSFVGKMIHLIETKDITHSKELLNQFFTENKELNQPKKIVLAESHSLITKLIIHFKLQNIESITEINKNISLAVYYQDVRKQIETIIEQIELEKIANTSANDLASKINQIIEEHYMNPDLSLLWISKNILFFNSEYLGREYSHRVGKKFNTKLTEYRIEMSKKLLIENYKVYEVAKMVGYENNPEYFNLVFKKHIGITPLKFTKLNQNKTPDELSV